MNLIFSEMEKAHPVGLKLCKLAPSTHPCPLYFWGLLNASDILYEGCPSPHLIHPATLKKQILPCDIRRKQVRLIGNSPHQPSEWSHSQRRQKRAFFAIISKRSVCSQTLPQAKRHQPSLLITSLAISTSITFITR